MVVATALRTPGEQAIEELMWETVLMQRMKRGSCVYKAIPTDVVAAFLVKLTSFCHRRHLH